MSLEVLSPKLQSYINDACENMIEQNGHEGRFVFRLLTYGKPLVGSLDGKTSVQDADLHWETPVLDFEDNYILKHVRCVKSVGSTLDDSGKLKTDLQYERPKFEKGFMFVSPTERRKLAYMRYSVLNATNRNKGSEWVGKELWEEVLDGSFYVHNKPKQDAIQLKMAIEYAEKLDFETKKQVVMKASDKYVRYSVIGKDTLRICRKPS